MGGGVALLIRITAGTICNFPVGMGRNRRARGYAPESRQQAPARGEDRNAEVIADPGWCDIEPLLVSPEQYILFTPPPAFMEQMVADRASCARDVEHQVVRAIARAVAGTFLPWHVGWYNWRAHASDFFHRLCSHRMVRARQTDAVIERLQERITALENAVAKLQTAKAAAPVLAEASHTDPKEDIDVSVFRSQLRAVVSRSPEPRRAVCQLLGVVGSVEARSLPDVPLS